jgi:hypothetical protein
MYVRAASSSSADPADSHVQARTAPPNPLAEAPRRQIHRYRERGARTTQPDPPVHPGTQGTQPAYQGSLNSGEADGYGRVIPEDRPVTGH